MKNDPIEAARWEFSEAWHEGKNPDVSDFCRRHPECGPELRRKIEDFLYVARRLSAAGDGDRVADPPAFAMKPIESGTVLGDFRIVNEIGSGGQGKVYEAVQLSLRRRVALKVLPPHLSLSGDAVKRFQREAEAAGRQKHPGIVAVHAVGEFEGTHYIVSELVEGGQSLDDRLRELRERGEPPRGHYREVARLVAEIADALHNAHLSGVIHRDVKPSNILIDENNRPKVTDFGLARVEDALALSRTGDFSGTPYYMSPEQAGRSRKGIDLRTDVYSLGVTLYEMLTLEVPFEARNTPEVFRKILLEEPRNPCLLAKGLPRDLSLICLKAMEKNRDRRYRTMAELADDLRRFLAGGTVQARPVGLVTRVGKWIRRKPALSALVGLAAVASIALVALLILYVVGVKRERTIAEGQRLLALSSGQLDVDPGLALLLALEGAERVTGWEANSSLIAALVRCREKKTFPIEAVEVARFCPDGSRIAVGLTRGDIEIWDCDSCTPLPGTNGYGGAVLDLEYSSDGQRLAAAFAGGQVQVWEFTGVGNFSLVESFMHNGAVRALSFNRDGTLLASASDDMTVVIRDLSGNHDTVRLEGHTWAVNDVDFSPDGYWVVTASEGGACRVWDALTGEEIAVYRNDLYPRSLCAAAFNPVSDRREIMAATADGIVLVWELCESTELRAHITHDGARLASAAFSPDGRWLATASADGTARVWDLTAHRKLVSSMPGILETSRNLSELLNDLSDLSFEESYTELKGHKAGLSSISFDRESRSLVTTARDKSVRIWDIRSPIESVLSESGWDNWKLSRQGDMIAQRYGTPSGIRVVDVLTGLPVPLDRSCFSANTEHDTRRIKCSFPGEKIIVRIPLDTRRFRFVDEQKDRIFSAENLDECDFKKCAFSHDSKRFAACTHTNKLKVWDLTTGKLIFLAAHGGDCDLLSFGPDNRILAMVLSDNTVRLVRIDTSEPYGNRGEVRRSVRHGAEISHIAFSSDGKLVVTTSRDGIARIWNPWSDAEDLLLAGKEKSVALVRLAPDDRFAAILSDEGICRIWDASTGEHLRQVSVAEAAVVDVEFSPCSRYVALATDDGSLCLHDIETGEDAFFPEGGGACVSRLFFCGCDSELMLTAADDETATLWNFRKRRRLATIRIEQPVLLAGFSCDGTRVITAAETGPVLKWPVEPRRYAIDHRPRALTDSETSLFIDDKQRPVLSVLKRRRPVVFAANRDSSREPTVKAEDFLPEPLLQDQLISHPSDILSLKKIPPFSYVATRERRDTLEEFKSLMHFDPLRKPAIFKLCELGVNTISCPCFSPDGKKFCYVEIDQASNEQAVIVLRNIENYVVSEHREICAIDRHGSFILAWHPSSEKIYFSARFEDPTLGGGCIYCVDIASDCMLPPVRIIGRPGQIFGSPHVSTAGDLICFLHFAGHSNSPKMELWTTRLGKGGACASSPTRLTFNDFTDDRARFSPDDEWIYRRCSKGNRSALTRIRPDGGDEEIVYSACINGTFPSNWYSLSDNGLLVHDFKGDTGARTIRVVHLDTGKERLFNLDVLAPGSDSLSWPVFFSH